MDAWMIATMASVGVGFLLFGGAFAAFMHGAPRRRVLVLVLAAALLVTVVPLVVALSHAVGNPG